MAENKCGKCDREFDSQRGLNIHKSLKHNNDEQETNRKDDSKENTIDFSLTASQFGTVTFGIGLFVGLVFVIGLLTGMVLGFPGAQDSGNSPSAADDNTEETALEQISGMPYDVEYGIGTQNVEWDGETVELEDRPYIGAEDADVIMVSYEDYFCPFCTGFHNAEFAAINGMNSAFGEIVENHIETGEVQYYFKNLPVVGGGRPAEVSECIIEHGSSEAFWDFNHEHFHNFEELSEIQQSNPDRYDEVMIIWADQLDVDLNNFENCIETGSSRETVQAHAEEAQRLGASATPTNFINGEMIEGAQSYSAFQAVIESNL